MLPTLLTSGGLVATLFGAVLLYRYAVPYRKINGMVLFGPIIVQTSEGKAEGWENKATQLSERSARLSKVGFALIAIGTLSQLVATFLPSS